MGLTFSLVSENMDWKTSVQDCYGTALDQIGNVGLVKSFLCASAQIAKNSHYFADAPATKRVQQ